MVEFDSDEEVHKRDTGGAQRMYSPTTMSANSLQTQSSAGEGKETSVVLRRLHSSEPHLLPHSSSSMNAELEQRFEAWLALALGHSSPVLEVHGIDGNASIGPTVIVASPVLWENASTASTGSGGATTCKPHGT